MSDNSSMDEVKRRLIIFLRIPAEVWTDVLKIIPRKNLVQNVSPACYRLKEIGDKNVKNIHLIENATQFTEKLKEDDPEANQQLEHLAANKCHLASQFRLCKVQINENSLAILQYCPDLFIGCKITFEFKEENKSSPSFLECLGHLQKAKPIAIRIIQRVDKAIDFWHHPTFQNCNRIILSGHMKFSYMKIFRWLHHRTIEDCDRAAASDQGQIRCMFLWVVDLNHVISLLQRCVKDIQQSQNASDRREYVLSFRYKQPGREDELEQFRRIENNSSGEVFVLDRVLKADGNPANEYRLRRGLAAEVTATRTEEFYAGMFKRGRGFDEFKIGDGATTTIVQIA